MYIGRVEKSLAPSLNSLFRKGSLDFARDDIAMSFFTVCFSNLSFGNMSHFTVSHVNLDTAIVKSR